jgi:hypothetical protein
VNRLDFLKRAELALAVLLTATALFLLVIRATHAGALWRDECGTVQLATMPKVSDVIDYFDHQTFPPLVPLIVRAYVQLCGSSDFALRALGLAAGAAFIGAVWWNTQMLGKGVPLLSVALFGLSPIFLTWGTTVGGYGFGAVLIILAFAATTKLLLARTPSIILCTFIAAIGSQQFVISNLSLVLTITLSAFLVALIHRAFKTAGILASLTVCAALIGVIYLRIFSTGEWRILFQQTSRVSDLWREFTRAYGESWSLAWTGRACFATIVSAAVWLLGKSLAVVGNSKAIVIHFALLVAVLSPATYFAALLAVGYRTHPWHYLLLLALLPAAMDMIVIALSRIYWLRVARLGFAMIAAIVVAGPAWITVHQRETNIDIVASKLTELAKPHDLIVVAPWQLGISFHHYYHGTTQWITLPNISDHRIHRYDLMLSKMISTRPIDDILEIVSRTLGSGHQVWFVGEMRVPESGNLPLSLPPAPGDAFGWDDSAYSESWLEQFGAFVREHSEHGQTVSQPSIGAVNQFEHVPLTVIDGWQ